MSTKKIKVATADIPNHCDVVFAPGSSPEGKIECGWIEFSANEKGRETVQRIFPKANFLWRECPYGWNGWQSIAPHVPHLVASVANLVPLRIANGKPLQCSSDNALSFLMAAAAAHQGLRAGFFNISFSKSGKPRLRFNIYETPIRDADNVLNMPTVRPFDEKDPAQAFMLSMIEKANDNIKTYDGTTEPIKKIIDSAQVVVAIWSDLTKPHGIGFLAIKGEDILKISHVHHVAVQATANAFICNDYEHALATKQVLAA